MPIARMGGAGCERTRDFHVNLIGFQFDSAWQTTKFVKFDLRSPHCDP